MSYVFLIRAEIRKIAAFLGVDDLTGEEAEAVATATTFEAMKNNPLTNYSHWDEFGLKIKEKRGEGFFRKGDMKAITLHYNTTITEHLLPSLQAWSGITRTTSWMKRQRQHSTLGSPLASVPPAWS